jgi:transposase
MKDKELFAQLLDLIPPWEITDVQVDYDMLQIHIWVSYPKGEKALCPECGKRYPIYDHGEERQWRHFDTMQFKTIIHYKIPRIEYPLHDIKSISVHWTDVRSHLTLLFERLAVGVLLGCQNQTQAVKVLNVSWDGIHEIQGHVVSRGLSLRSCDPLSFIGIEEKNLLKGHSYATLVANIERSKVLEVTQGRYETAATEVLEALPCEVKSSIKAVVDMWEPYINAIEKALLDSDIVHDKFHIIKHINEAVDKMRKEENNMLLKGGDYTLRGTKYLWLTRSVNLKEAQRDAFCRLKETTLKTGRAWSMKETFSPLWRYNYRKSALNLFGKWYFWATHSRAKPMIATAKMFAKHIDPYTYLSETQGHQCRIGGDE